MDFDRALVQLMVGEINVINEVLFQHNVHAGVLPADAHSTPTFLTYRITLGPGVRVGRVTHLRHELTDALSRYRKHTVSSLMLWMQQRESREGGTKIERFQTPLTFFLELLALLLFVLAAVGPKYHAAKGTRPLVVVLDDSYSMLAGGSDSFSRITYTGFAIILFLGLAVFSLFVLRAREPAAERPFRAWLYPVAPALYVIVSAAILVNGLIKDPRPTGAGALIIVAGIPLYYFFKRKPM